MFILLLFVQDDPHFFLSLRILITSLKTGLDKTKGILDRLVL